MIPRMREMRWRTAKDKEYYSSVITPFNAAPCIQVKGLFELWCPAA